MARLHQLHPGNYRSGSNIDDDFANLVRYIVAAERGDKSLSELSALLFDTNGDFTAVMEVRFDGDVGLEYRVGNYTDSTTGWQTIAAASSLRGTPGLDLGTIEGPLFTDTQETTATAAQTVISYTFETTDDVLVFIDGVLQTASSYTKDAAANTITLDSALAGGEILYVIKVRASSVSEYRRTDAVSAGQAVFPFVHTNLEQILVYRNGLLQRPGGSNDYTNDPASDTITFTSTIPASDVVTILTVENSAEVKVTGLMTEANWTASGYIPYAKLSIADNDIPQAKVNGLTALLTNRGRTYVSATEPVSPSAGDVWVDSSSSPYIPKFYDGTQFLRFSPATDLPTFATANAGQVLHINTSGTGLIWKAVDLSAYVPLSSVGAASGVASLDAAGRLPASQLPSSLVSGSLAHVEAGAVANGNYVIQRFYKEIIRIDARAIQLTSGTADITLQVDGVDVADTTVSASSTPSEANYSNSIQVDASSASKTIGFKVASGSSPVDLDFVLAIARESF